MPSSTARTTRSGWQLTPATSYWANDPDGTINRANLDGSGPHTIIGGQAARDCLIFGSVALSVVTVRGVS